MAYIIRRICYVCGRTYKFEHSANDYMQPMCMDCLWGPLNDSE